MSKANEFPHDPEGVSIHLVKRSSLPVRPEALDQSYFSQVFFSSSLHYGIKYSVIYSIIPACINLYSDCDDIRNLRG
ncbi:hypothetical protein E2C01_019383 [Portunus trituberculatus]|uniref:Uncharacterized protein n=1 Tax=Portunus trituberculatus TaxID=210409 RepID=A0A5B7DYW0_PORTR|nr:hypothetical protein [Portunus trituberculatus]